MSNVFLALDTELGGIDDQYSLLTAYFEVFNDQFESLGSLDLKLKSDPYILSASAMEINKISITEHDKLAETKSIVGNKLYHFLYDHYYPNKEKLIPVGHGVAFDLRHIWNQIINRATCDQFVSYRRLDTGVIAQFQKLQGLLPESVSGSLESLKEHYGIPDMGDLHVAKTDAQITMRVLQQQLKFGDKLQVAKAMYRL